MYNKNSVMGLNILNNKLKNSIEAFGIHIIQMVGKGNTTSPSSIISSRKKTHAKEKYL